MGSILATPIYPGSLTQKDNLLSAANCRNLDSVKATTSVLIVGATGLVGVKLIECVKKIAAPGQIIYVLSRRHLFRQVPGVIVKVAESDTWAEEISRIPNLTTVYSALGDRSDNTIFRSGISHSYNQFYHVIHNLTYQIAVASKNAGASNFIFISHHSVSFMIPRAFDRRTKVRNWTEKDLETLKFERLVIVRPGPLIGLREKTGLLKGFSLRSIAAGALTIASEPLLLANPITPLNTFNFAASVAKTSAIATITDQYRPVMIFFQWDVVVGELVYDLYTFSSMLGAAIKPVGAFLEGGFYFEKEGRN